MYSPFIHAQSLSHAACIQVVSPVLKVSLQLVVAQCQEMFLKVPAGPPLEGSVLK